jgi:hypothetical protein
MWIVGFGDLSWKDEGEAQVFGSGPAAFGKLYCPCQAGEGLG